MADLLLLLLVIPLLGSLFVLTAQKNENNAFNTTLFALGTGIVVILRLLSAVMLQSEAQVSQYTYAWLNLSHIELIFGADLLSLILLFGIYLGVLVGMVGLLPHQRKSKAMMLLVLAFIWSFTGLILARDVLSFYLFFAGIIIPVFMLVGMFGEVKKSSTLYVYFALNFVGALLFLTATIVIYRHHLGNIGMAEVAAAKMPYTTALVLWMAVCFAFLLRLPIWPCHYWLSLICVGSRNPVVCIITNLLPLTGILGFMRFWEQTVPESMDSFVPIIDLIGVMTMLFVAFIGVSFREFLPKLFTYSAVYYLLFLLVIVLLPVRYEKNIAYSLFIFMIVNATLVVLELWAENAAEENDYTKRGILAYMPRLARLFTFFVLIAAGLPLSSMFWNNFVLISALFRENFAIGIGVMLAITLIVMSMVYELFVMRDLPQKYAADSDVEDISEKKTIFFLVVILLLLLSFFNPLWFVF